MRTAKEPTLKAKCKERGLNYQYLLQLKYDLDFTDDEAIAYRLERKELKDKKREACKKLGLTPRLIANRLFKGWTLERALTTPVLKRIQTAQKVYYKGVPLKTFCRENGINLSSVNYCRKEKFWSVEESVEHCLKRKREKDERL